MAILALDHVQVAAPPGSEDAARQFYGEWLGFTEIDKPDNLRARGGVWFASGAALLHIGIERDFVAAAKAHPAFLVDDLARLLARLAAAGVPIREDEPLPGYQRAYVSDPFGNRIELMQRMT